jgi:lipopolysaccharide biosynthesis glycosyltransferase
MKKAIFTIMIGEDPSYFVVHKAFEKYAARVGAELVITTSFNYGLQGKSQGFLQRHCAWLEKVRMKDLLQQYDRVLYIDADILISPDAPDIFLAYPETDTVYMLNEGQYMDRGKTIAQVLSLLPLNKNWPKDTQEKLIYYNVGVMLMSKESNLFQHINMDDLLSLCGKVTLYEQTYLNYLIMFHNLKAYDISQNFNRMDIFGHENYLNGHFIHYAGGGYCRNVKLRYRTIIKDYLTLYNSPRSQFQQLFLRFKSDLTFLSHQIMRNLRKPFKQIASRPA